jgi:predicted Zn-dependent peptidase
MYAILKVESRAKILGSLAADNRTHDINDWLKDMQKVTCAEVLDFAKKYLSIQKQNELLYFSKSN